MSVSLNTNSQSFIAQKNLRDIQLQLQATQKRVSTGYAVADAFDNGAVYGVAQLVRGDISGNQAASAELGNFHGLIQTAAAAAHGISNSLSEIRAVLTHLSSQNLSVAQFRQYSQQFYSLVDSVENYLTVAAYNQTNLLSTTQTLSILADGLGNDIKVNGNDLRMTGIVSGPLTTTQNATMGALAQIRSSIFGWGGSTDLQLGLFAHAIIAGEFHVIDVQGLQSDINLINAQPLGLRQALVNAINFTNLAGWDSQTPLSNIGFGAAPHALTLNAQFTATGIVITSGNAGTNQLTGEITLTAKRRRINAPPRLDSNTVYGALRYLSSDIAAMPVNTRHNASNAQIPAASFAVQRLMNNQFIAIENNISTILNRLGTINQSVLQQLNFNQSIRNALSVGLGSIVDADLSHESAILTASQVKISLATNSLAIANQSPNILVRLFAR